MTPNIIAAGGNMMNQVHHPWTPASWPNTNPQCHGHCWLTPSVKRMDYLKNTPRINGQHLTFFKTKVSQCSNIFICGNFAELAGMLGRVAAAFFEVLAAVADPLLGLFPMRLGLQEFCTWQFQDRFFAFMFPGQGKSHLLKWDGTNQEWMKGPSC